MTRFAVIDREKALHDVTVLCKLLKASRSGFYAWLTRPKSDRALADEVLTEQIRAAFFANRKVYGSPKILAGLADEGVHVPGVIHHSDRGGEYSSYALERELLCHRALASMGPVADCFDNALAENLFATLECEPLDQQPGGRFEIRREAKLAVFDHLETFYNPRRRPGASGFFASQSQAEGHRRESGHSS